MTTVEEILSGLELEKKAPLERDALRALGLPDAAAALLARLGAQEIEGDFIVPDMAGMVANNTQIPFLPAGWICFADTGSGDLWLLPRSGEDEVAFLDHDKESSAVAQPMGIGLGQWLQLAWFMRGLAAEPRIPRKDTAARARRAERKRAFLAELSPTLLDRYPYKL